MFIVSMFIVGKLENMDEVKKKEERNHYPMANVTPWGYIKLVFKIYEFFSKYEHIMYTIL